MKRFKLALAFIVVTFCMTTAPKISSAQEILLEGPLAGAPAVRKLVQYREHRFSAGAQFAYTLNNQYMHNFLVGLRLEFNITDWLGVGAIGYYGINAPTSLTNYIAESENIGGATTTPTNSNFPSYTGAAYFKDQVGLLKGMYLGQVSFTPFRGKMSMFEKLFVAIDGSIFVGGGIVHIKERPDCVSYREGEDEGSDSCGTIDNPKPKERETRIAPTFTWGVNFMAYFNDWFAINLEYRMTPFKWNSGGTDEAGQNAPYWELDHPDGVNCQDNSDQCKWISRPGTSGGDYPDGNIDKDDRTWNVNQSIALGAIFYFPFKPAVTQ